MKVSEFKCKPCEENFFAIYGSHYLGKEYRCVDCDAVLRINWPMEGEPPLPDIYGNCECGGEMRGDILPMCSKCKSRDYSMVRTVKSVVRGQTEIEELKTKYCVA